MRVRRILTAAAALALIGGTAMIAAPTASAQGEPIVWYQAIAVSSVNTACPTTSDADKSAGWSEWTASWAEWPNDGKGGYVCTRSITWAWEADTAGGGDSFPSVFCVLSYSVYYSNFGGGWALPGPSQHYSDPDCAGPVTGTLGYSYVFAPDGPAQATFLCQMAFGVGVSGLGETGDRVYQCATL